MPDRYGPAPCPISLTMNRGDTVSLGGDLHLKLRLQQFCSVAEVEGQQHSWQMLIKGYNYVVYDVDEREILVYHWHPGGPSPVVTPHLHLKQGALVGHTKVRDAHLPTSFVELGLFLRMLICDFAVQSKQPDWDAIL